MRRFSLLLLTLAGACAAPGTRAPSLAPRAAEAIDPRIPVPAPPVSAIPTEGLVEQLRGLVAQASAGHEQFEAAAANAERLAAAAGTRESESWVVAQQALSAAVAARAPVARALADIDALSASRIRQLGGIGAADMKAIGEAAARVAKIDSSEAATISRLQTRLAS
ncbi:MAG TPA: hypothetical protein VFP53_04615 [Sphingomicrobium sp.]|nr:hypothetical protein [Sphingomicrobium sp.]